MRKTTVLCVLLVLLLVGVLPTLAQEETPAAPTALIDALAGNRQPTTQRTETIAIGDSVSGELSSATQSVGYKFEGEAGQYLVITLATNDWDSYLVLQDANGAELAADDDSGPGSLDSRIGPFKLPATGSYLVIATTYDQYYQSGTAPINGTYTLSVEAVDIKPIEYTQTVNGSLAEQPLVQYYTFSGQAGDVISVKMSSDVLDNYIQLYGGSDMAYPLTTANGSPAWISAFTLQETGDYIISASSYYSDRAGDYTLELDKVTLTPIAFGDEVTAELTARDQSLYFTFEGQVGDTIRAVVDSGGAIDTSLSLNDPSGYQLAYSDDAATVDPAIENVILTQAGTYTLIIAPYEAGTTGELTLLLARSEVASLDDGPVLLRFSSEKSREMVSFTGEAGTEVRVTARKVKGDTISPTLTITQEGSQLAYASASYVTRQSLDLTIPASGQVFIQIDEYSYTDVAVEVSVEPVPE